MDPKQCFWRWEGWGSHFQPILIENLSNSIGIDTKFIHWHSFGIILTLVRVEQTLKRTSNSSRCKKPRLNCTKSYEELLKEDHSRAKRARMEDDEWLDEPAIILGYPRIKSIRVASLGPALKRKFVHPGGI